MTFLFSRFLGILSTGIKQLETETQVIDVQSSNPGLVTEWKRKLSDDVDIITTIIRPDSNRAGDGGLGISLEGILSTGIKQLVSGSKRICKKQAYKKETETQVIDVQSSNPGLVTEWKRKLSDDVDIITTIIRPDSNRAGDGGLGISLEGTVDVVKGHQLCPHHYIESIRQNGPAAVSGILQAGDELLQVNHSVLYGESHVTVRQALSRAVHSGAPVTLVVARRSQQAKSEVNVSKISNDTEILLHRVSRRLRARSLEPLTGLAVWNCVPLVVCLMKDERGLGFSIVDYQDPAHPGESVIVVQSLVPGGLAQADGRIVPGDRLLFVNQHDLSNSSLERAVAVLKAAPMGKIRIGIAKPIPIDQVSVTFDSSLVNLQSILLKISGSSLFVFN
ncbi:PDZ/DHR/GLGF domain protein [Dictyocaulus viviparus]|uniref:PDZ/DHR/GLGF domain protein n=1 Tax=Dictyocaulus viviparus TaxID=29172 RepID=A0A0D8XQ83_DICVI|nr:PDZ/DHR/GLGF domain protein [Dictyocaulus viviparus]